MQPRQPRQQPQQQQQQHKRSQPPAPPSPPATPPAPSTSTAAITSLPTAASPPSPVAAPATPTTAAAAAAAEALHDEALYEELRGCEHWRDVLDVVHDEGPNMSTRRLVQALSRFGALVKAASRSAPAASASATPSGSASVLEQAAVLERGEATSLPDFQALLALLYARLHDLGASQASATAMTLAQLGVRPPEPQLALLAASLRHHAAKLSARDVATAAHSFAALVGASGAGAASAPAASAAGATTSASSTSAAPSSSRSDSDSTSSSNSNGSSTAAASGTEAAGAGTFVRALLDALSQRALQLLQQEQQGQQQPQADLAMQAAAAHLDTPAPAGAAAAAGPSRGGEAAAAASASSVSPVQGQQQQQQDAFTPQGLSMLLGALAHLKYPNSPLLAAAADAAVRQMDAFTPQGISLLLWSTATLDHYFPALVNACLAYFRRRGRDFKAQELSNLIWALTKLRHHPQQLAQDLTAATLDQCRRGAAKPGDVATLLQLLATFCIVPSKQAMFQLCERLDVDLPRCSAAELSNALWALGLLGETNRPVFSKIAGLLPARFERGEMDDGLLRQTFQAFLCAKLAESAAVDAAAATAASSSSSSSSSSSEPATAQSASAAAPPSPSPSFPPLMLDSMKRLWVSMIQAGAYRGNRASSPTKVVSEIVSTLRVRHDAARASKDGLVLIDVALRPSETRYVALQVLRAFDHTRNTGQLLGQVQLERQILEKNGWEVKYLMYEDLLKVEPNNQLFFIAEYLKSIGCRLQRAVPEPGAKGGAAAMAAAAAAGRGARGGPGRPSEAAREAGMVLDDPKARAPRGGRRG